MLGRNELTFGLSCDPLYCLTSLVDGSDSSSIVMNSPHNSFLLHLCTVELFMVPSYATYWFTCHMALPALVISKWLMLATARLRPDNTLFSCHPLRATAACSLVEIYLKACSWFPDHANLSLTLRTDSVQKPTPHVKSKNFTF